MRRLALLALALGLPLAAFVRQGLLGLDFGRHWDERQMVLLVRGALAEGRLRPRWYHYPALPFLVARAALATTPPPPRILAEQGRRAALVEATRGRRFRLRTRAFFLAVSALAVPAAGLLALALGAGVLGALLAALLAAGSFELAYHARWFAPDGPLTAFGTLSLAAAAAAARRPRGAGLAAFPLLISTAAAALAASCKITGSLFLAAPLAAAWRTAPDRRRALVHSAASLALFALLFVVVTPGVLLDRARFVDDLRYEMTHYGEKGHYGYTIDPGAPLLARLSRWIATEALSPFPVAAATLAVLALFGLGERVASRTGRAPALAALLPALLLLVLLARQRVLFVRNALPLVPLLAAFAAAGALAVARAFGRRPVAAAAVAGVLLLSLLEIGWLEREARGIRDDHDGTLALRSFAAWLASEPDGPRVLVPANLAEALSERLEERARARLVTSGDDWRYLAFRYEDHPRPGRMPSNVPHLLDDWFGRRQVNLPWYTTWLGRHVFLVERDHAAAWHFLGGP